MATASVARRARRAFAVLGGGLLLTLGPASVAAATEVAGGGSPARATVGDSSEAYYATGAPADPCTSPVGCPPASAGAVFPADTLHVGEAAGRESFRTYVTPDLTRLPPGATPVAGTMTLPVATDPQSGTSAPDQARLQACLATAPAPDGTAGSPATPPAVDATVCAPATYHATSSTFTVSLTPFLVAWGAGEPQDGIALLPAAGQPSPAATWQVAFNGRSRAGYPHIRSVVSYVPAAAGGGGASAPAPVPAGGGLAGPRGGGAGAGLAASLPQPVLPALNGSASTLPATGDQAPQVASPSGATPATTGRLPDVALSSQQFRYPAVFLLPLALLAGGVFLARLFTRDPLAGRARS